MRIKEILLADIQNADPELLKPLYEVWQILKKRARPADQAIEHPMAGFFGSIDMTDAQEMHEIIEREFGHIEGEW